MKTYNVVFRNATTETTVSKVIQFSYMDESNGLVKFFDDDDGIVFSVPIYLFNCVEVKA